MTVPADTQEDSSESRTANFRPIEDTIATDLAGRMTYAGYLDLERLLGAQHPVSQHHDEMLFIVQHQVSELWLKLLIHELRSAISLLRDDDLAPALKRIARVKHVQKQLLEQWAVLATLTPAEYVQFRDQLGPASGFQSLQYRTVEFLLGNKNAGMLKVFSYDPAAQESLHTDLTAPSLYDEFLRLLARRGFPVPAGAIERDWAQPYQPSDGVVDVFRGIYQHPDRHWDVYETAEEFVDVEDLFQQWRFRHMKTVERIIGHKTGTGGSSGVAFLRRALDLAFFPELLTVRTSI